MSEKLDGVRAYWTGSTFYSRNGNKFHAPKFFTEDLPKTPLDGELWCGRGLFSKTISIVKKSKNPEKFADDWKYVTYLVFDAPSRKETYEQRVKYLNKTINAAKATTYAAVVGVQKCRDRAHLQDALKAVMAKGGEGLMLRQPGSLYENKRSSTLLKVKVFHDEEAKVLGMSNGTGRCANMMGKLHCVLPNGVKFDVGSGFNDSQRKNPPKVGSVITFKFQEVSDRGNPRFPIFLRARTDMTWDDVCRNAKTKPPFSQLKKIVGTIGIKKQHSILFSTVPSRDPKTGAKIVTDDDGDDDEDEAKSDGPKPMCKYGLLCFRTNDAHLKAFTHPPKPTPVAKTSNSPKVSAKTPCRFGKQCYRTNKDHLAQFSHDVDDDEVNDEALKSLSDDEKDDDDEEESKVAVAPPSPVKPKRKVESKSDDWGLGAQDSESESDCDSDEDEMITITMPRKQWDSIQTVMTTLQGMSSGVTVTQSRKRNRDDPSTSSASSASSSSSSSSSAAASAEQYKRARASAAGRSPVVVRED